MNFLNGILICIILSWITMFPQDNNVAVTGNISGSTRYYFDIPEQQTYLKKFDYLSNSNLTIQADNIKFTANVTKPMYYFRAGQPDKYFSLELSTPIITSRLGDINVQFTPNTTPYIRIFGFGVSVTIPSLLEISTVNGISKLAVPTEGYMLGSYGQELNGHRISVTPIREIKLGGSYMRIKDDPKSMDFSGSTIKIPSNENILLSGDASLFLFNRKLTLGAEYIASIFNYDNSFRGGKITRYDTPLLQWLGDRQIVQGWMNVNDSTAAGEVIYGKINLSVVGTNSTVEYKKVSRNAYLLTFPYEQPDIERIRFNNSTRLFSNSLVLMINGQYNRTNVSHSSAISTFYLNLNTSLSYDFGRSGRTMVSWRHSDRYNDAALPTGKNYDKRVKTLYKSLTLSHTIEFGMGSFPISLTGSVTGNWNENRIRKGSDTEGFNFQVITNILPPSIFFLSSTVGYGWNLYQYNGSRRNSLQAQFREGWQLVPEKLQVYLDEGIWLNTVSGRQEKTLNLSYGIGVRWEYFTRASIEFEWEVVSYRDYQYTNYNYLQNSVELRLNYAF